MAQFQWIPAYQRSDFEIQGDDLIYNGFFQLKKFQLRHRCFTGEWSSWLTREYIHHTNAAAALLWDPVLDRIVMVEQFRVGLINSEQSPWLLEIVAGLLDEGENPEKTIHREIMEETGYTVESLEPICAFYNTPGGFAEKTWLYCGIIKIKTESPIFMGLQHDHEDIKVHVLPCDEVINALTTGKLITSASTVLALQWLKEKRKNNL